MDRLHLKISVNILEGTCKHLEQGKKHRCDCRSVGAFSERTYRLLRQRRAKISFGVLDLSFLA